MSWMRRGDEEPDQTENEWISQLLEPLQSDDQPIDEVNENAQSPVLAQPEPGTRSVAEVINQLDSAPTTQPEHLAAQQTPLDDSEITAEIPAITPVTRSASTYPDSTGLGPALTEALSIAGATAIAVIDAHIARVIDYRIAEPMDLSAEKKPWNRWRNITLDDDVEELFITLHTQYHVIRAIGSDRSTHWFFYLVLDRHVGNLAMARHRLGLIESQFTARQSTSAE